MTSDDILAALRHRHAGMQWAFFTELRTGTGYDNTSLRWQWRHGRAPVPRGQRLDAFAINCWPSKGETAIAYEVKTSRSDFLRELEQPQKRHFAEQVSSECYFAAPFGMLKPDEIPEPWGLIGVSDKLVRVVKQATLRTLEPWPFWFIASICRRVASRQLALPMGVQAART